MFRNVKRGGEVAGSGRKNDLPSVMYSIVEVIIVEIVLSLDQIIL